MKKGSLTVLLYSTGFLIHEWSVLVNAGADP